MPLAERLRFVLTLLAAVLTASVSLAAEPVRLTWDRSSEPLAFAAAELTAALRARGHEVVDTAARTIALDIATDPTALPRGFAIRADATHCRVTGANPAEAMYGALELAEQLRLGRDPFAAGEFRREPHIAQRGIKFNLPLDLRTPSYSDCSDAAQANIPVIWEREFWTAFLDSMARHRYNVLSLWSLHPFPSMVKVPEYPQIALADVWRTRAPLDDTFNSLGLDMVRPAMLADREIVKSMSIDEKIAFWRWVMAYAKDRGIDVYVFTWNVFTFGTDGKYGIDSSMDNPVTKAYFRASVRELVTTYPLLAGLGVTSGEAMPHKLDARLKEAWMWDTYGEGVRDALKHDPARTVRMIHRFHWTSQREILDAWKDYPGFPASFDFSYKYSVAHMYSIPNPNFIQPLLGQLAPGLRTWLTVRNDDLYTFRFGDPDFLREYLVNLPSSDRCAGFYMGPDGYTWGRSFLERHPAPGPRPLVIEKQWYSFLLMGRLAYDPTLSNAHCERLLGLRFPGADAPRLFRALQNASRTMPLITRFFWGDIDVKWFPEACLSHPRHRGFYTVKHFVEGSTMPGAGVLNIRDWRAKLARRLPMTGTTPLEIADALQGAAAQTFDALAGLRVRPPASDSELAATLDDCEALALLARYYAARIRGACALAQFDLGADPAEQATAIRHLEEALQLWKRYADAHDARYLPALFNRIGFVDLNALAAKVAADIDLARAWKPGTVADDTPRTSTKAGSR